MDAHSHRSEYKFTIRPAMVPVLREKIGHHLAPDRGLASGYLTITEYFDSQDDLFIGRRLTDIRTADA